MEAGHCGNIYEGNSMASLTNHYVAGPVLPSRIYG